MSWAASDAGDATVERRVVEVQGRSAPLGVVVLRSTPTAGVPER
jgi:hypothetical protein